MRLRLKKRITVRNAASRRQWTLRSPVLKFSSNILIRTFDDDHSVGSVKSGKTLLAQLFFQNATVKVTDPIGEASGSGDYPLCDSPWTF